MRIADVWPEYARHDKKMTTLRHALTHAALMGEVDGVRLISPKRLHEITTVQTHGPDWGFGGDLPKTLGYVSQLGNTRFGWSGNGGSLAGFYPELGLALAITKNCLGTAEDDPMEGIAAVIHAGVTTGTVRGSTNGPICPSDGAGSMV